MALTHRCFLALAFLGALTISQSYEPSTLQDLFEQLDTHDLEFDHLPHDRHRDADTPSPRLADKLLRKLRKWRTFVKKAKAHAASAAPRATPSSPPTFVPGEWVDVKVLSPNGRWTGSWRHGRIGDANPDEFGTMKYDLVDRKGRQIIPALRSGIRNWHLRRADAPAGSTDKGTTNDSRVFQEEDTSDQDTEEDTEDDSDDDDEASEDDTEPRSLHTPQSSWSQQDVMAGIRSQVLAEIRTFDKARLKRPTCNTKLQVQRGSESRGTLRDRILSGIRKFNKAPFSRPRPRQWMSKCGGKAHAKIPNNEARACRWWGKRNACKGNRAASLSTRGAKGILSEIGNFDKARLKAADRNPFSGMSKAQPKIHVRTGKEAKGNACRGNRATAPTVPSTGSSTPSPSTGTSTPSHFAPGDWVDVQVVSDSGKPTGQYAQARVAAVRADGRYDLVYPDGTKVVPALGSGIRRWHLRKAAPWVTETWTDPVDKTLNRASGSGRAGQAVSAVLKKVAQQQQRALEELTAAQETAAKATVQAQDAAAAAITPNQALKAAEMIATQASALANKTAQEVIVARSHIHEKQQKLQKLQNIYSALKKHYTY